MINPEFDYTQHTILFDKGILEFKFTVFSSAIHFTTFTNSGFIRVSARVWGLTARANS